MRPFPRSSASLPQEFPPTLLNSSVPPNADRHGSPGFSSSSFFAGFCLAANGAYLLGDAFVRGGDGRELIAHGTPPWALVAFGLPTLALGLALWNGLGPHFGLGPARGRVDRRAAAATAVALAILVAVELVFFAR